MLFQAPQRALLAVALGVALMVPGLTGCSSSANEAEAPAEGLISASDAYELIDGAESDSTVVLDVRTPEEYRLGHIPGAVNINYYDEDFKEQVAALDPSQTYIVYCRCGVRGQAARDIMAEAGFQDVWNLEDGFLEWQFQSLPSET